MTTKELEEQLIQLPEQYEKALRRQTETIVETERLEFEIEKLKLALAREENSDNGLDEDTDEELIVLDTELEKLKQRLSEAECRVEIDIRTSHDKVTESYVKALVLTDSRISQLRNELVEAKARIKIRKAEIQRKRSELWEKRRQRKSNIEDEKIMKLKNQLRLAEEQNFYANDEVEVLKVKLDTLRLLTDICE